VLCGALPDPGRHIGSNIALALAIAAARHRRRRSRLEQRQEP
jgi:hypothetical protein